MESEKWDAGMTFSLEKMAVIFIETGLRLALHKLIVSNK